MEPKVIVVKVRTERDPEEVANEIRAALEWERIDADVFVMPEGK